MEKRKQLAGHRVSIVRKSVKHLSTSENLITVLIFIIIISVI